MQLFVLGYAYLLAELAIHNCVRRIAIIVGVGGL